jgi:hypothetical protein
MVLMILDDLKKRNYILFKKRKSLIEKRTRKITEKIDVTPEEVSICISTD